MELQTKCDDTLNGSIQNTSADPKYQQGSETKTKQEPMTSEQNTDQDEDTSSPYYTLLDLERLTFTLDGVEVLNALDATPEQFGALAALVADVTNVGRWYVEDRRDFINGLQVFCEESNQPFPFVLVDADQEEQTGAPLSAEEEQNDALAP